MSMQTDERLHPCPICGAKAFVEKDVVDGFYFGWSVGCPLPTYEEEGGKE